MDDEYRNIWWRNRRVRDELKFSERLDEVKQVVDEVKDIDDRYFYNNETMLTYMIEKYNVPVENLPVHWDITNP